MPRRMLGLLGVSLLMGCSVFQPHKDLVAMGKVHVEPISTNEAELPPPKVIMSGDVMTISGVVKRKPNYNGPLDGHVKIELLDASQKVIGQFPTEWTPSEVPVNGKRQADYSLEYGWVPPDGTTVRVSVVQDTDEILQQAGGGNASGPHTGGNPQGLPTSVHTPSDAGHTKSGFAPGTPGMAHQGNNSPSTPGADRRGHR